MKYFKKLVGERIYLSPRNVEDYKKQEHILISVWDKLKWSHFCAIKFNLKDKYCN